MIALFRVYTALLMILLFTNCSTFSRAREANMRDVHPGMSKEELVKILGSPESRESSGGGTEKWHYQIISSDYRRYYPYTATFENGVLSTWYLTQEHSEDGGRAAGTSTGPTHNYPRGI